MSFRQEVVSRIGQLLQRLVIEDEQTQAGPTSDITYLRPNQGYRSPIRKVLIEPIETTPEETIVPRLYVSFDGGRRDAAARTFISHLVEVLGIRVDIVLSKLCGVEQKGDSVRPITFQIADALADIQELVTKDSVATAVTNPDANVNDVYFEEWNLNDQFRGSDVEVINLRIEVAVTNPRETT